MNHTERQPLNLGAVVKLTALWGLAESGLGGILFAFRLPVTGFLLGAVSIVLLSLIAQHSNNSYRRLIGATVTVLMVKAAVSPHSPPPAYLAVLFQGFIAALLFRMVRSHKVACMLLGIISMAESSLQKILVLTLIFGKNIWEAVNNLGKEIVSNFHLPAEHNYALWIIGIHLLLYMIWGAIVGSFAARLPARLERKKDSVISRFRAMKEEQIHVSLPARRPKPNGWMGYAVILFFIITVFVFSGANNSQVIGIMLRTVAAILLLIFVAQPLAKWLFRRWLRKRSVAERSRSELIIRMLPRLRGYVPDAYALAKTEAGWLRRGNRFLIVMIILTLYVSPDEEYYFF